MNNSGYNLYVTSKNRPYIEGTFTGVFLLKDLNAEKDYKKALDDYNKGITTVAPIAPSSYVTTFSSGIPLRSFNNTISSTTTTTSSSTTPPPGVTVSGNGTVQQTSSSSTATATSTTTTTTTIPSNAQYQWLFYPLPNYSYSEVYGDSKQRYVFKEMMSAGGNVGMEAEEVSLAVDADYTAYTTNKSTTFIRLEIDKGGDDKRNNFHHPCLKGQYLKYNGQYFKIINQLNGNVIDVSVKSANGTATLQPKVNDSFSLVNQYGWLFNEYYMTEKRTNIFEGSVASTKTATPIESIDTITTSFNANMVQVDVTGENNATWTALPPKWYKLTYFTKNNFYERFTKVHSHLTGEPSKMYKKGYNWKAYINYKSYDIESFSFVTKPTDTGQQYTMKFFTKEDVSSIKSGDKFYINFYPPYSINGTFNGQLNITMAQGSPDGKEPRLCLNGYWISPQVLVDIPQGDKYVGVCDGRYFGIDPIALRNDNALLFVTTNIGATSISSICNDYTQEEWVAYIDYFTKNLTIRKGTLGFCEYPRKMEVCVGESSKKVTTSTTTTTSSSGTVTSTLVSQIDLDTTQERLRHVQFDLPNATKDGEAMTFTIKNKDDYYGFPIPNNDTTLLRGLLFNGFTVPTGGFKNQEIDISPVYVYAMGNIQRYGTETLSVGMKTKDGPIYVKNGKVSNVLQEYVYNNQVISGGCFFDLHVVSDGEPIILYGQYTSAFNLTNGSNSYLNNSEKATTPNVWSHSPNCVMIVGSNNSGRDWGCPTLKKTYGKTQYAMAILNNVDYMCSTYNDHDQCLMVIAKCYTSDGVQYIGCYTFAYNTLAYKYFECTHPDYKSSSPGETPMKFLWRPPALEDTFLTDNDRSFTSKDNVILDGYSWTEKDCGRDTFTRVMGNNVTGTSINDYKQINWDNMNIYVLKDDTYCLLFDASEGVRMVFSQSHGMNWTLSPVIMAKAGSSGLIVDGLFYFINRDGLNVRITNDILLQQTVVNTKGISAGSVEALQNSFDKISTYGIGTGTIYPQKISGHKTVDGNTRIFYYDINGLLSSVTGSYSRWKISKNF